MNRLILSIVLSIVFLGALAAAQPALAETKIATIRAQEVVQQSPQYKSAQARMKAEFEKRQSDLNAQGSQLDEDVKKYQRDADTMSPEVRARTEKDLLARRTDFEFAQRKFQEDASHRDRELTAELMDQIKTTIAQVAKEKGIDVIISDPVYTSADLDLTDEVLKRLQAANPAKAKPAAGK